ncbi:MAG: hypothetical protein F6J89_07710 [Symploca sp. SIO1C4]|uniref:Uncharacterized protein n=1 Tax=Symploca sp. SIO1C4 TaxID=2607765 RepID=A0A6B3N2W0_9CYAN|nr:hypothetical protein [Symploca sp. SIO1C4]
MHNYRLLSDDCRPEDEICVWRSYSCQREPLIKATSNNIQRMPQAFKSLVIYRCISVLKASTIDLTLEYLKALGVISPASIASYWEQG